MTPDAPSPGHSVADPTSGRRTSDLPKWFPPWATLLADLYFSGTTSAFVLHGNTHDLFRIGEGEHERYGVLGELLAEQLFGRWSLVLHYDLGRGLRPLAGRDEKRLKEMVVLANKRIGDLSNLPRIRAAHSRRSTGSSATTSWRTRAIV